MRGVTEHYLPSQYDALICHVKKFEVEIKNFIQMEIRAVYAIADTGNVIKTLYNEEEWKLKGTRNLLERYPKQGRKLTAPGPLFCLMLNKGLQVTEANLRCNGSEVEMIYDQDADMLVMPTSFPPLVDITAKDTYIYYDKKSTVFYSDIHPGTVYELVINLEANASYEFAPLFPFGKVIFEKTLTYCSGELDVVPMTMIVKPYSGQKFPEWYQYQLERLDDMTSRDHKGPRFRPALPDRGTMPLFNVVNADGEIDNADSIKIDISKPIALSSYETLCFGFGVLIPPDKNIDVIVRTINRPLASRIYEQVQRLPNYRDVLVEYNIFNLSQDILHLWVETEILGYSEKETKYVLIHSLNNEKHQKARAVLVQCPRLKRGILEHLISPTKATMRCRITNKRTKEVLFEETFNIDILPNDEMVWELDDLRSNHKYNLRDFICAWVTPRDKAGLLDKIRSEARKYHPDNTLGHQTGTLEDIKLHVKALYNCLSDKGMNYLSQPFSSLSSENSQRVVLPEKVLENNAGNCIDLTVLFASLLEAFGIYSLIMLTPSHAFIGWGDKKDNEKMFFLETTAIGRYDFDTAMAMGKKVFETNFLMEYKSKPVFIPDIARMRGCYIVDLRQVRHTGQVFLRI